jgi:hypothetical protein
MKNEHAYVCVYVPVYVILPVYFVDIMYDKTY